MAKAKIQENKEEVLAEGKLNEVIYIRQRRPNGSLRIQQDYSFCPTMAEQHTAHMTDINYLMEKYQPDELSAYLAARNQYRKEILGHDFSQEPSLQDAKNVVYRSQQTYEMLPEDITRHFKSHVDFLKFIDNPANAEKMIKLGLISEKQVEDLQTIKPKKEAPTPPTTQEETKEKQ